jgi:hypothetical protein
MIKERTKTDERSRKKEVKEKMKEERKNINRENE